MVHTCHSTCVEVREQLVELVLSLLGYEFLCGLPLLSHLTSHNMFLSEHAITCQYIPEEILNAIYMDFLTHKTK